MLGVGRWVFGVFCQIGCVETTEGTAARRARLPNSFTEITDAAEELAGRASYDVDDDRRYAALNRSGVGDRNFLRVHTAVSGKDVAVDRRGMGFSLQQDRCRDCGNAARCSDLGDAGNLCRRIPSRVLEPSASGGSTHPFSPVWFERLCALARIFAGRLAHLLARLCWFAFSGCSLCDHCLFSHAPADQPRQNPAKRLTEGGTGCPQRVGWEMRLCQRVLRFRRII